MHNKSLTIALADNPNSGKTTIFNNITGTRQKVGNWPGVTVEKNRALSVNTDMILKLSIFPELKV